MSALFDQAQYYLGHVSANQAVVALVAAAVVGFALMRRGGTNNRPEIDRRLLRFSSRSDASMVAVGFNPR